MIGEKYLNALNYETGLDTADDSGMYEGCAYDTYRWTTNPPSQDFQGVVTPEIFGSAHAGASFYVFCDGSVQSVSYSVDPSLHKNLGNVRDGQLVDMSQL